MSERRPPDSLAGHLAGALPTGAETASRVRITQRGEMVRRPGEKALPFAATQEFSVHEVGFEWRASFGPNRLVRMIVVDRYRGGAGSLSARVWGLLPVTRSSGPETDRAEAIRYLAELPWVPHAIAANGELSWRRLENGSVEVSTAAGGRLASVVLSLDQSGLIGEVSGMRPRIGGQTAIETAFTGRFGDYGELGGVRVPRTAEMSWELPEGPFTYWRGEVTSLEAE